MVRYINEYPVINQQSKRVKVHWNIYNLTSHGCLLLTGIMTWLMNHEVLNASIQSWIEILTLGGPRVDWVSHVQWVYTCGHPSSTHDDIIQSDESMTSSWTNDGWHKQHHYKYKINKWIEYKLQTNKTQTTNHPNTINMSSFHHLRFGLRPGKTSSFLYHFLTKCLLITKSPFNPALHSPPLRKEAVPRLVPSRKCHSPTDDRNECPWLTLLPFSINHRRRIFVVEVLMW